MAQPFSFSDTVEVLPFREVRDGCVVTDTHLAGVLAVTGVNLYEKNPAESVKYLEGFAHVLSKLEYPVQLVALSRPKRVDGHCARVKASCAGSDFEVVLDDAGEWYDINYAHAVSTGKLSPADVAAMSAKQPLPLRRSVLGSYAERVEKAVAENGVTEKRYYLVVSTLDKPTGLSEKEESPTKVYDWDSETLFAEGRAKLSERLRAASDLISKFAGMACAELGTQELESLLFDAIHFPLSQRHDLDRSSTLYGAPAPFVAKAVLENKRPPAKGWWKAVSFAESAAAALLSAFSSAPAAPSSASGKTYAFQHLVKPYCVDDSDPGHVRVNGQYCFTLHITRFAKDALQDLELWPILTLTQPFDLAVHLVQLDRRAILVDLERSIRQNEADIEERVKGRASADAAELRREAASRTEAFSRLADSLRNGASAPYSVSIDVTFRASSLAEMAATKVEVLRKFAARGIVAAHCDASQWEGFVSTLPILTNLTAGHARQFDRSERLLEEVSHLFPFCPLSVPEGDGVMLGLSVQGEGDDSIRGIELFDLFDRTRITNSNMVVIGNSGSGKTTFAHGFIKHQMLLGNRFLILDYLGNYLKWAQDMPGAYEVVRLDPTSPDKVNPCDLVVPDGEQAAASKLPEAPAALREALANQKVSELAAYFKIFLGTMLDPFVKGLLDDAAKAVFVRRLAKVDVTKAQVVGDVFLSDIVDELQARVSSLSRTDKDKSSAASRAAGVLSTYATGSMSGMFNAPTTLDVACIGRKGIVFSLRGNPSGPVEEVSTLQAMMLIKRIAYASRNNIILIDELHKIFRMDSPEVQDFFQSQVAMIRNLRGGMIGMTQVFGQIMSSAAGKNFFEICVARLYLAGGQTQGADGLEVAKYDQALSKPSQRWLLEKGRGHGLFKTDDEQIQLVIQNHPDLSLYRRYEAPIG